MDSAIPLSGPPHDVTSALMRVSSRWGGGVYMYHRIGQCEWRMNTRRVNGFSRRVGASHLVQYLRSGVIGPEHSSSLLTFLDPLLRRSLQRAFAVRTVLGPEPSGEVRRSARFSMQRQGDGGWLCTRPLGMVRLSLTLPRECLAGRFSMSPR